VNSTYHREFESPNDITPELYSPAHTSSSRLIVRERSGIKVI